MRAQERRRSSNFLAARSTLSGAAKLYRRRLCSATRSLPQNERLCKQISTTDRPFKDTRTRTTTFLKFSRRPLNLERRRKGPSPPLVFGNALAPVKRAPVDADCCVLQKHGGEFAAVLWIGFSTRGVAANRSTLKQTARDLRARNLRVCHQVERASPEAPRHGK